jgi:hypothetical protein
MCGCMLMHSAMDHQEHNHATPASSAPGVNTMPALSGQRCTHCNFPLQQGFAFCPGCGMSLQTMQCPSCGQKVESGWSACAYCGSPLGEIQGQPAHH